MTSSPPIPEASAARHGPTVDTRSLENDHLRIELDDQGLLSSIFDKSARTPGARTRSRGNRFQLHPDYPNFFDAWDIDRFAFDQVVNLDEVESMEPVEQGPLRAGIRRPRRFGESRLTQVIRVAAGSPWVDFDTEVQWHETNRLLKVAFPVDVRSLRATYEIQYGHVERPTHANTSWDVARFEVCAHKWADLSEPGYGVALLNDCKYGYDIAANVIRLSLLRAPTWPDPVADRGDHRFHLPPPAPRRRPPRRWGHRRGLRPERSPAGRHHLVPILGRSRPSEVTRCSRSTPTMSSWKWSKRPTTAQVRLVVRLYERGGRRGPVTCAPHGMSVAPRAPTCWNARSPTPRSSGAESTLTMTPFQIVTLKLERGGPRESAQSRSGGSLPTGFRVATNTGISRSVLAWYSA
jgi:alpha-mannosidase